MRAPYLGRLKHVALFGIPTQALSANSLLGLINGAFYALLSLGLAVIFGLLNIINFSHGALYMMGAFAGLSTIAILRFGYWPALILVPLVVGLFGIIIERLFCNGYTSSTISTACCSPSVLR